MGVTKLTPRLQEKLKQRIIQTFKDQGLGITIEINQKRVNFLDLTLDMESGLYKNYRKPGDKPLYVSAYSNHPPQVLKNIPLGIGEEYQTIQQMSNFSMRQSHLFRLNWIDVVFHTNSNITPEKKR